MPEDAKEAVGHGVRGQRSKSGAVSRCWNWAAMPGPLIHRGSSFSAFKAQAELGQSEKSLTATIRSGRPGRRRSFVTHRCQRTDIARKILGQHEIATAIRTVAPQAWSTWTTTLAHASAMDRPPLAGLSIAETANPSVWAALTSLPLRAVHPRRHRWQDDLALQTSRCKLRAGNKGNIR